MTDEEMENLEKRVKEFLNQCSKLRKKLGKSEE